MPKKRTDGFQKLTIAQQQEIIERFTTRKDVRDLNDKLSNLVLSWLLDQPIDDGAKRAFMREFNAAGHQGQYHASPTGTTNERIKAQTAELPNLKKRIADTPLDYMGALELSFIYERIQLMVEILETRDSGTQEIAINLYRGVGEFIRQKIFTETGHYPEEFPIPDGRITGDEEPTQFRLTDHQPSLLGEEDA